MSRSTRWIALIRSRVEMGGQIGSQLVVGVGHKEKNPYFPFCILWGRRMGLLLVLLGTFV